MLRRHNDGLHPLEDRESADTDGRGPASGGEHHRAEPDPAARRPTHSERRAAGCAHARQRDEQQRSPILVPDRSRDRCRLCQHRVHAGRGRTRDERPNDISIAVGVAERQVVLVAGQGQGRRQHRPVLAERELRNHRPGDLPAAGTDCPRQRRDRIHATDLQLEQCREGGRDDWHDGLRHRGVRRRRVRGQDRSDRQRGARRRDERIGAAGWQAEHTLLLAYSRQRLDHNRTMVSDAVVQHLERWRRWRR